MTSRRARALALLAFALGAPAAVGCGRSAPAGATLPSSTALAEGSGETVTPAPMDERERMQWAAAKEGDAEEAMRLADLIGCEGLRERGQSSAELRGVALRAIQYCGGFSELPWLVSVAAGASDGEATEALEAIVQLAARPRRATDPEDADELHDGCAALLAIARDPGRPRERRVLAVRALRMLSERGCVKRADIPTELDAR